jgi:hypothetical protein
MQLRSWRLTILPFRRVHALHLCLPLHSASTLKLHETAAHLKTVEVGLQRKTATLTFHCFAWICTITPTLYCLTCLPQPVGQRGRKPKQDCGGRARAEGR